MFAACASSGGKAGSERLFGLAAEKLELENATFDEQGTESSRGTLAWTDVMKQVPPQDVEMRHGTDAGIGQRVRSFILGRMGLDL